MQRRSIGFRGQSRHIRRLGAGHNFIPRLGRHHRIIPENLPRQKDLRNPKNRHRILIENRLGHRRLNNSGVDPHGAIDPRNVEREAAGAHVLRRERRLHRVHDRFQRPERVIRVKHMKFQHDGLLIRRQGLQPDGGREVGERGIGGDEEGDPGAALVGLELVDDAGGGEHGGGDVEVVAIDQGAGDVQAEGRAGLGGHEIEAVGEEEGVDGEDADIVGEVLEEGQNGGV